MYNKFYGFSKKPFDVTPDPRFLYLTPGYREALASMIYGIKERRGFISVTGEVGTGKTTLIYSLLNSLGVKIKTVLITHTRITFKELLKKILLELGVSVTEEGKTALLQQLNKYLIQMIDRDETLAVIIDEAQNLSKEVMEELRMLSNFETRVSKLIQIVFVGQSEFEIKLNSEDLKQLNQRIGVKRQIRPLSEEESREYIDHRLRLVGKNGSELFTPQAISLICRHAKGIPRIINMLCDNAFLIGYSVSKKMIDEDIIHEVINDMESPISQKTASFSHTAVKGSSWSLFKLNFLRNKTLIAILSLLCLGGLLFLTYGYLQLSPTPPWNNKPFKSYPINIKPFSTPSSPEMKKEGISKEGVQHQTGDPQQISTESFQPVSPQPSLYPTAQTEDKLKEIITVGEGQNIFYLTQKSYRMSNETLVDLILELNPEITNVHLIEVNQTIKMPKITEESLIIQSSDHTYKIHVGTFNTFDLAKLYRNEPALKGKAIEILPRKVSPQDTWYRVVIGNFDSKDEVLRTIYLLKGKNMLPHFGGLSKM